MPIPFANIQIEQIVSVYSGKPGCCCGCRGNHRYAEKLIAIAGKERGYAIKADEISDRSIKVIFNRMKKLAATKTPGWFGSGYLIENGDRIYNLYLLPSLHDRAIAL